MKNVVIKFLKNQIILAIFLPLLWVSYSVGDDHKESDGHGHAHSDENNGGHDHDESSDEGEGHDDHVGHAGASEGHDDHEDHSEGSGDHGDHHGKEAGHGDHDEHGGDSFGEGKAITEVEGEGEKFKLAPEAQKLMGLKYGTVSRAAGESTFTVPTEALIFFNDEKGVFVKEGEWYRLVEIKLVEKDSNHSKVKSQKLSLGQKIVVAGTGLLRVAHLQASGQGGKGHAH